jgi:hypothetical protein
MSIEAKKICKKCGEEKPLFDFYKQKANKDGHLNQCKPCRNEVISKWSNRNKEYITEIQREINRKHYVKHRKQRLCEISEYARANKHLINARVAKRRAMQLRLTPSWADKKEISMWYEVAEVLSRSGVRFEVDHVVPLKGKKAWGFHSQHNLQVLPAFMNRSKGAKHVD